jgi:type I restriction enzyme S subunit
VDSELGPIPADWKVVKLGEVIELAYGKGLRKKDRIHGMVPVYGSSGIIDWHNEPLVEGPGIVVGRKGNVGSVFWSDVGFCPIDTVFYVVTDVNLRYVFYNLQDQNFLSTDTAVPGLNRNQAYLLPFVIPEKNIIQNFERFVEPVFDQVRNLNERNTLLRRARDLLLPRLISGEVDVSDLDIRIGDHP